MLKILYVSAVAERGGQEVILLNIVKGLDRSEFAPLVLFLEDGPFVREVEAVGVDVHLIKAGRVRHLWKRARVIAEIEKLIQQKGIHVVHTYNAKAHIYGGLAAAFTRVPCLYHLQGVPKFTVSRDGIVSLLSVVIPAQRTVACSRAVANAFRKAWWLKREVIVVHSGVALEANATPEGALTVREEFGIPNNVSLIVMACRLQRWKGVHVFLDAAAKVVSFYPETRFMVVGGTLFGLEEGYAAQLREQADRLGLASSIIFTGFRSDVYRFLAAADLIVHSSIALDPFPTVILEAMALGKPVVASDLGGPRESLEDGVTGFLVPPRSPEHLAEAIPTLLNNPDDRIRMGYAGALRFHEYFVAKHMVRQFETLYEQMTGERLDVTQ